MSFNDRIKKILSEPPTDSGDPQTDSGATEELNDVVEEIVYVGIVCPNFWCKVNHQVNKLEYMNNPDYFKQCPKCRSFDNSLSDGVINNGTQEYDGNRYDPEEQPIEYKEYDSSNVFGKKNR